MRHRRDLDDLDESLFDQAEAAARREARAQRLVDAEQQARDRAAEDAATAARSARFHRESNARAVIGEYQRAGVEPLKVDADGVPTCSLSLLLSMGWTVEDVEFGARKLVAPPAYVPPPVKKYVPLKMRKTKSQQSKGS